VAPIRVVLGEPPAELRAALGLVPLADQGLIVVGEPIGELEILLSAAEADVVVLGMAGDELPPVAERLLDEYPRIAVLAIAAGGTRGLLYRLRPQLTEIGAITPAGLAAAIRRAADPAFVDPAVRSPAGPSPAGPGPDGPGPAG
jgi:hypothetical protein